MAEPYASKQTAAILDANQMDLLGYAIRHHTGGKVSEDPTIGACWDSERLDLGRVGIIPVGTMMSTRPGKEIARIGSKRLYMECSNSNNRVQVIAAEREKT